MNSFCRGICILLSTVLAVTVFAGCSGDDPKETENNQTDGTEEKQQGLRLSESDVTLTVGDTGMTLKAYSLSTGKEVITVTWESADESVVQVNPYGELTAVGVGSAAVRAKSISDQTEAICNVTVVARAEGITLDSTEITIMVAGEHQIVAQMNPPTVEGKFTYQSQEPGIASVSEDGKITGLKSGTTQIIVSAVNTRYTATCTVKVCDYVTDITMNDVALTLSVGESRTVSYTLKPLGALPTEVKWVSSDPEVVSVGEDGKILAVKAGTATVTVTVGNGTEKGVSASVKVTVAAGVRDVILNQTSLTLDVNQTYRLSATVTPDDGKEVVWSSSDSSVATVSSSGEVRGVKIGKAVITATTADGTGSASCQVSVGGELGVRFEQKEITLNMGNTLQLTPIFTPEGYSEELTWAVSDRLVLNVDSKGLVTAKGVGTATVTATGKSSGIKASITVKVEKSVLDVQITQIKPKSDTFTVPVGEYAKIELEILPENATEAVTYKIVKGEGYVRITAEGVFAVKEGFAIIVAQTPSGVKSAEILIEVQKITDNLREKATKEYNNLVSAENKLNADTIEKINKEYDPQIKAEQDKLASLGIVDEADYNAQKEDLQQQIDQKQKEYDDSVSSGDEELAKTLNAQLNELKEKLEKLENSWLGASKRLETLNSLQSQKQTEVDAENARHNGVLNDLNQKYDYLLPYLEG